MAVSRPAAGRDPFSLKRARASAARA